MLSGIRRTNCFARQWRRRRARRIAHYALLSRCYFATATLFCLLPFPKTFFACATTACSLRMRVGVVSWRLKGNVYRSRRKKKA
jgi:hypothetical protein